MTRGKATKKETRNQLKARLMEERFDDDDIVKCEAYLFRRHECGPGRHMHEVFYKRNDVPRKKQAYIFHEINCAILCSTAHEQFGNSVDFTKWFLARQVKRYGKGSVVRYIIDAPTKVKSGPPNILPKEE